MYDILQFIASIVYIYIYTYIYIHIYGTPPRPTFCCLDFFDTYPTCNGVAMPLQVGWIQDSRFKIPTDSFQQILNPGFKIQDSQGLFAGNLESRIQDGFKICSKEFLGILNLESWGWIQDLLQSVPGNLES